jgi:hypothetical protein
VSGANVTIISGANAGQRASTNSNGDYSFAALTTQGSATVAVTADGYQESQRTVTISAASTLNFTLTPSGPRTWTGSFTATGTFQLDSACVWSYVEEFTNVRLTLANGTGTLTALVRTTEGPKVDGPARCPNNTFVRQQNDLFQLSATPTAGGFHFELVSQPAAAIRSLRGTASGSTATGTYSLRTGAIGAGGIRQTNADFTLTQPR